MCHVHKACETGLRRSMQDDNRKESGAVGKRTRTTFPHSRLQGEPHKYYTLCGSVLQDIVKINEIKKGQNRHG